ncbi:putative bifunctional diguanylate cyclase/phosphodiesterase [Roseomonas elaeocarpi]|uniref:Bifunctional diguanylate cyclase/phosphodiesterase n=1 Tax=Roseomonas elaeocarpi TaxID=907779 RepID=A0ABV6JXA1_9PROT
MDSSSPSPLPDAVEADRLASLQAYAVLDTPPDPRLDALTRHVARLFQVPIAAVTLIDETRQWRKALVGCLEIGTQTERVLAICSHLLSGATGPLVVEDLSRDPRFAAHPQVMICPSLRFYAGAPLIGREGLVLGALCILDTTPRRLSPAEVESLAELASVATALLDLHRCQLELQESVEDHRHFVELNPQIPWIADPEGRVLDVSPQWLAKTGFSRERALGSDWLDAVHPDDRAETVRQWSLSLRSGQPVDIEYRLCNPEGGYRWFRAFGAPRRGADGTILRWYGTVEDVHDRKMSQAHVEYLAYHDSLTGLWNRARFDEVLQERVAQAKPGSSFALMSIDLDGFKAVNDSLGHLVGDDLLRQIGQRLDECVRGAGLAARAGGDEFHVLQDDALQPASVRCMAERILQALASPLKLGDHTLTIGASIGIAAWPAAGEQPLQLLQNADLALYRAKAAGGGCYRVFETGMGEELRRRQTLKVDLSGAIERGELELAFQPIVDLRSGRVGSFEALMRWNRARRGLVAPAEFIPTAEETGLILPIGRWALEHACTEAAGWPAEVKVAVNLSPFQFRQTDLAQDVAAALRVSGLSPGRLVLEITESLPLLGNCENLTVLHRLRELGVQIALDDFGTGYASLGYLHQFRFDNLKVDRSFVCSITKGREARTILHAVTRMAHMLGMTVTAEGVETPEQLRHVQMEGCDHVQGYFFSRPVPASEVGALIASLNGAAIP